MIVTLVFLIAMAILVFVPTKVTKTKYTYKASRGHGKRKCGLRGQRTRIRTQIK